MDTASIKVGQLGINYIVDGSPTKGLGMFELPVPPGSNVPPPHNHSNNEEYVYVLARTLRPPDKAALVAVMSRYGLVLGAPK